MKPSDKSYSGIPQEGIALGLAGFLVGYLEEL